VENDSVAAHLSVKKQYKRPRPFLRDTRLTSCIGNTPGFAYPSGHSVMSRLEARILCELDAARCDSYLARADETALLRVIAGVHHPSDIEGGKMLGDIIYGYLAADAGFAADLNELRALLR
jgi:acid phosphatase (class A)